MIRPIPPDAFRFPLISCALAAAVFLAPGPVAEDGLAPAPVPPIAAGAAAPAVSPAPVAGGPAWPQFRGPRRDGVCGETGLLASWNSGSPTLLWKAGGLGAGYSGVAIVDGRIFTLGDRGGDQMAVALDLATRGELWRTRVGAAWSDGGPRSTPTVDAGRVYVLSAGGDLVALRAEDGGVIWRRSLKDDFGGKMMSAWGYSESPLVDGDRVICTPGGKDAGMVALEKATGKTVWSCAFPGLGRNGNDGAGYSSAVVSEGGGVRQYVQMTGRGLVGVAAGDGRFLWGYNRVANTVANVPSPVVDGDLVFASTSYGAGAVLLELERDGAGVKAVEKYFLDGRVFQNHHGGMVLVGGYIYAGHGQNRGLPTCIDLATGKVVWQERENLAGSGSAAVLYADGNLYFRYESGAMALVAATPEGYRLKGNFPVERHDGPGWAHPVICGGKLYLRGADWLFCYDVTSPEKPPSR